MNRIANFHGKEPLIIVKEECERNERIYCSQYLIHVSLNDEQFIFGVTIRSNGRLTASTGSSQNILNSVLHDHPISPEPDDVHDRIAEIIAEAIYEILKSETTTNNQQTEKKEE